MKKEKLYVVYQILGSPWQLVSAVSEKQALYFAKKEKNWDEPVTKIEGYEVHCIGEEVEKKYDARRA